MIREIPVALPTLVMPALVADFNHDFHQNYVKKVAVDLRDTVISEKAYGCAANQFEVDEVCVMPTLRVICVGTRIYVNPKWWAENDAEIVTFKEGCLSFPGLFIPVKRPNKIGIEYQDTNGRKHNGSLQGIDAICFQHEVDHLDGKVFFRASSTLVLKRAIARAEKRGYQYTLKQLGFFM